MASTEDLAQQLAALADDLGSVLAPTDQRRQLTDLCELLRVGTGSGSVSIARVDGDDLVYEAAFGTGADGIIGVRMSASRGIAGYVARTGQSLIVDQVQADPRFARDVAERTGYLPGTLLVVPVTDGDDEVLGVVSVLDRSAGVADPLAVASATARVAAPILASYAAARGLGALLVRSMADALATGDESLAGALRRQADDAGDGDADPDDDLPALAALLAEVRSLPPAAQHSVARIIREAVALAAPRRRR